MSEKIYPGMGQMKLRDYLAAKVLPFCYAEYMTKTEKEGFMKDWREGVASDAYALADAMLKVRDGK